MKNKLIAALLFALAIGGARGTSLAQNVATRPIAPPPLTEGWGTREAAPGTVPVGRPDEFNSAPVAQRAVASGPPVTCRRYEGYVLRNGQPNACPYQWLSDSAARAYNNCATFGTGCQQFYGPSVVPGAYVGGAGRYSGYAPAAAGGIGAHYESGVADDGSQWGLNLLIPLLATPGYYPYSRRTIVVHDNHNHGGSSHHRHSGHGGHRRHH